ncbi:ParB/RepB/Spo0J family partition protein [Bifidobacterium samirii]
MPGLIGMPAAAPAVAPVVPAAATPAAAPTPAVDPVDAAAAAEPGMDRKRPSMENKVTLRAGKRATMPGLDDIAHPADLFFGETVTTAAPASAGTAAAAAPTDDAASGAPAAKKGGKGGRGAKAAAKTAASGARSAKNAAASSAADDASAEPELKPVAGGYLAELRIGDIGPNAHQPRTIFDEDELAELAASINEVGVLQPIVVRRRPVSQIEEYRRRMAETAAAGTDGDDAAQNAAPGRMDSPYELIMGERRWRASQKAGMDTIPAIVKTTADTDMLRDALLENLHRVALNPLEEAAAYQQMIEEFGLTQAQLSKSVSKSRPQIANTLRLLNLPAAVQKRVAAGVLSAGHARALLALSDEAEMDKLATRIIAEGLSVRSTEEIVSMMIAAGEQPRKARTNKNNPWAGSTVQQHLENRFDTKVSIKGSKQHGRIEIVFSSPEDMDRILDLLMPAAGDGADAAGSDDGWK